jgi:hypothetical protein
MTNFKFKVNKSTFSSVKNILCGKEILELAGYTPVEDYELLLKTNLKGYEPIQLDEEVDLTIPGIEHFSVKLYKTISIEIDGVSFELDECNTTPNELLMLAGYNSDNYYLTQIKNRGVEIGYKELNDANHKIQIRNGSKFCLYPRENQKVIITIDEVDFKVKKGNYTGAELKVIGNVTSGYELEQVKDGIITIEDNTVVEIVGSEVFISHPRDGQSS